MLLNAQDGIRCDFCGSIFKDKFKYYAVESNDITVVKSQSRGSRSSNFEHDACETCYGNMVDKCKANIGRILPQKVKCDFCPTYHSDTFTYKRFEIHAVDVDIDREKPTVVERRVMDFNVGECCFKGYQAAVDKVKAQTKREGEWS